MPRFRGAAEGIQRRRAVRPAELRPGRAEAADADDRPVPARRCRGGRRRGSGESEGEHETDEQPRDDAPPSPIGGCGDSTPWRPSGCDEAGPVLQGRGGLRRIRGRLPGSSRVPGSRLAPRVVVHLVVPSRGQDGRASPRFHVRRPSWGRSPGSPGRSPTRRTRPCPPPGFCRPPRSPPQPTPTAPSRPRRPRWAAGPRVDPSAAPR